MRAHHREADSSRVIRQAAAVCLAYPEPDVLATAGLLRAALAEKSSRQDPLRRRLRPVPQAQPLLVVLDRR
jgi:hypothetical protein